MGSQIGVLFRVQTFGESHGPGVGCVVDGCPAGIPLSENDIQPFLDRRRPGQSDLTTPRQEGDRVRILSGVHQGQTLGSPIALFVENTNMRPVDYQDVGQVFRPSHADWTWFAKYGVPSPSGGGRTSARETIGRVAAGAVAQAFLQNAIPGLEVLAWVQRVAGLAALVDPETVTRSAIEAHPTRCPDPSLQPLMESAIREARDQGDTLGGSIGLAIRGLPPGLGEPSFDRLEADWAKALLSLPAAKAFSVGSGWAGTFLRGSENNDAFVPGEGGVPRTLSNHSGGIQGGISNGATLWAEVGFKPVSTLFREQQTVTQSGAATVFKPLAGRHDSCVLPRAAPMCEAQTWLLLADHWLRQRALRGDTIFSRLQ